MNKIIILILTFSLSLPKVQAQFSKYIIVLKDKNNTTYSLNNPSAYLSAKAIARREKQNISIDSTDIPVNAWYIDSIRNAGAVTILNASKWLNQVLIQTTDNNALDKINQFAFVKTAKGIAARKASAEKEILMETSPSKKINKVQGDNYYNYGNSYAQINIHEGEFLHNNNFRGEGMTIAVLDAGFYHYDTNPLFDSVRINNQVLGTWDFVANKTSVTEENAHGMLCFSTIAANKPGVMVGTAPKAKFYLFRTEEVATEYPVEEQNWVAAAEMADSLGVDLITTSLGYTTFDNPSLDYTYANMNGKTTICAKGAAYAFKKGMFISASAGNSGNSSWHYIATPADGENVLAVGSVTASGTASDFSSYGPSSDGRMKPDVVSVGSNTVVAGIDGNPTNAYSGTSLSNPNFAGLVTCLWQAFPERTNAEILDAVRKSSSQYNNPDTKKGYGIPNMRIAYNLLQGKRDEETNKRILGKEWIKAYPVPFTSAFNIVINPPQTSRATLVLYDAGGKKVLVKYVDVQSGTYQQVSFNTLSSLAPGVYWLTYNDGKHLKLIRLVKQ
ncbi:MAG: S8 family serine peptidase [Chitinophagaceae bacterium]|nr:S8 family serine peptidase [Chitinophagaceae bacterium]